MNLQLENKLALVTGSTAGTGFAEAMSDDGKLRGRGTPWIRGAGCGLMTTLGGLGHTMPYLIRDFHLATTIALVVVTVELAIIAWIRKRYMDTPLLSAVLQVVVGGVLVFLAGWLMGMGQANPSRSVPRSLHLNFRRKIALPVFRVREIGCSPVTSPHFSAHVSRITSGGCARRSR